LRVLVTGPGRLGGPLLAKLHQQGVTGAVLQRNGVARLPAGWRSVRADVTRPESLAGVCRDCEQVLHLAAITHTNSVARYDQVNVGGTRNLVAEARRAGVARFTLVSTCAISPEGGAYSRSKLRAEQLVRDSGLAWNILRPAEVYGSGGEGVSALIERCRRGRWIPVVGAGGARLAPVYLDDVLDGICRAVFTPHEGGVHQLAGPEEMTYAQLIGRLSTYFRTRPLTVPVPARLLEVAARALALLPLDRPPLVVDQVARLLAPKSYDGDTATKQLGFKARPLEAGLDALFHAVPGRRGDEG
jgi:nucleoside-diphosphate-sugar epimerase